MDCRDVSPYVEAYGDGELGVSELAAVEAHLAGCLACQERVAQHRRFRQLLRRQPQEAAPAELRARVGRAIRVEALRSVVRPRRLVPVATSVVLAFAAGWMGRSYVPGVGVPSPALVNELVGKHLAYSQVDSPVEFAAANGQAVTDWFRDRLGLRVTVPDYAPAGIHLLGGRIAETRGRKTAYLLYEKGHTLMSVFMVPGEPFMPGRAKPVAYRGATYYTAGVEGQRAVLWSDGRAVFGVVSTLDYDGLLECADRLRTQRAEEQRAGAPQGTPWPAGSWSWIRSTDARYTRRRSWGPHCSATARASRRRLTCRSRSTWC